MEVGLWLGLLKQVLYFLQFGGEVVFWEVSCSFDAELEGLKLLESAVGTIQVVVVIVEDWFLKDVDVLLEIYELIFLFFNCDDGWFLKYYLFLLFLHNKLFLGLLFLTDYYLPYFFLGLFLFFRSFFNKIRGRNYLGWFFLLIIPVHLEAELLGLELRDEFGLVLAALSHLPINSIIISTKYSTIIYWECFYWFQVLSVDRYSPAKGAFHFILKPRFK